MKHCRQHGALAVKIKLRPGGQVEIPHHHTTIRFIDGRAHISATVGIRAQQQLIELPHMNNTKNTHENITIQRLMTETI
jgi:hypothetical protein